MFFQEIIYLEYKMESMWWISILDDKKDRGTHWISWFIDKNTAVYSDSFGLEYISQEVFNKVKDKSITHNIFSIQDNDSIMCVFCCIAFVEYVIAGENFLDYTHLFLANDFKWNGKIIYKYFEDKHSKPWL